MHLGRLSVTAFQRLKAPFTLDLSRPGLTLVLGENGVGKSLYLVEALLWAGWGKMARHGDRAVTDDAMHPLRGADVSLEIGGLKVHRRRAPKGAAKVTVETLAGASPGASRDPSKRGADLEAWLGLDYRAFQSAVVIHGERVPAQDEPAAQMALLESVLRLSDLAEASERARKQATKVEQELAVVQREVALRREAAQEAASALDTLEDEAALRKEVEALKAAHEIAVQSAAGGKGLQSALEAARQKEGWARVQAGEATGAATARAQTVRSIQASIESAICPTCGRPMDGAGELDTLRAKLLDAAAAHAEAEVAAGHAQSQVREAQQAVLAADRAMDAYRRFQAEAARLEAEVEAAEGRLRLHRSARAGLERRAAAAQAKLEESLGREAPLAVEAGRLRFWVEGFGRGGLQAEISAAALPVLNAAAARYAQWLTGGTLGVQFQTLRTARDEPIIQVTGAEAPTYRGLSRGQKRRVNLIVAWALRAVARWRLGAPINVAVYDEVFDGMDEAGIRAAAGVLQSEAEAGQSIFVITHSPTLRALFPATRIIRVSRDGPGAEATVEVEA